MDCERVRAIKYRKFLEPDKFFHYGRPHVEPPGITVLFRRPLDKILLYLLVFSVLVLIVHFLVAFYLLPALPKPPPNASHDCATLVGAWNSDNTVLRFFGIPYAIPPLAQPDEQTIDVLRQYTRVHSGTPALRWTMPLKIEGIDGCILTHHDRCSFRRSRWTCYLGKARPVSTCYQSIPRRKVDLSDTYNLFQEEKCLQVDITAPAYGGVLKPVIVVIAGFQFFTEPLMPPQHRYAAFWPTDEAVRETDAVWVYLHYRLGLAGFFYNLTSPSSMNKVEYSLMQENYAIHDQMTGLRWIQQHVRQFGGDNKRVTVLGYGSGATSTLALLYLQGKRESLFRQAWLASGAVHWPSKRDRERSRSIVEPAFTELVSRYMGTHCITERAGTLVKSCILKELRQKLMKVPLAVFNSLLATLFDEGNMIGEIVGSSNRSGGLSWICAETRSGNLPPPKYWTSEGMKHIFAPGGEPIRVVFSSTSNELEGWPRMGASWMEQPESEQIEQIAEILYRFRRKTWRQSLKNLKIKLGNAWKEELSNMDAQGFRRSRQEFHLKLLSLLRFSCPQSWILSKMGVSKGTFYKLYLDEPPDFVVPHTPGPRYPERGTPPPKRFAFHGLDMMILTGKRVGSRDSVSTEKPRTKRFRRFKSTLKETFTAFVHGRKIDSQCKTTTTDPYGCRVTADGVESFKGMKTLREFCEIIDWSRWISHIVVYN